jgi:hypothetical protein
MVTVASTRIVRRSQLVLECEQALSAMIARFAADHATGVLQVSDVTRCLHELTVANNKFLGMQSWLRIYGDGIVEVNDAGEVVRAFRPAPFGDGLVAARGV